MGGITVFLAYTSWNSYLSFYDNARNNLTWDWGYFGSMIIGVFFAGFLSGTLILLYQVIRGIQKDAQRAMEREKLKEEIKQELERERQKERT